VQAGGRSWFFVTADYAFGHAMERDAAKTVTDAGGLILGSVRHPLGTADFSSFILQAEGSGAEVIGLANAGGDTANALRSAREFGLTRNRKIASFIIFITDVDALGLETAQDLLVIDGFYWDQNETARRFAERFQKRIGRMPTKGQAAVYASVTHYLKAVAAEETDASQRVNEAMRRLPVDYVGRPGSIRADGRVTYDLTLYKVKTPAESRARWDYYKPIGTIPSAEAFRPAGGGGCSLDGTR
jgi:branched-chain amino acid transport system substrate-binding protein